MNLLPDPKPFEWLPRRADLIDTAADDDVPLPVPHWGPVDSTPTAAKPWPVRTPDQQRAECQSQRFTGRLEGALIGFALVMVLVVGGCTVIAAMDRVPLQQTNHRPATA
jgi:hypothetical protein